MRFSHLNRCALAKPARLNGTCEIFYFTTVTYTQHNATIHIITSMLHFKRRFMSMLCRQHQLSIKQCNSTKERPFMKTRLSYFNNSLGCMYISYIYHDNNKGKIINITTSAGKQHNIRHQ